MLILVPKLYLLDIFYWIPDHPLLLNEFIIHIEDLHPYPKIHHFLDYWRTDIEAAISTINIIECQSGMRFTVDDFRI
jgi:uncharacterized protein Usg